MAKQKAIYEDYIFSQIRWKQQIIDYNTSDILVGKLIEKILNDKSIVCSKGFDNASIGWNIRQQSLFIESLLLNIAPQANSIITLKIPEACRQTPEERLLLIDGRQRIVTLKSFLGNAFPLQRDYLSLLDFTMVFYKDLPEGIRRKFMSHTAVRVVEFNCENNPRDFERVIKVLEDRFSQ